MTLRKNHIDKTFKAKLKNFHEAAPSDVWEGVAGVLEQGRKRNRLLVLARIAASAALIISVGAAYLLLRYPADNYQAGELVTAPVDTALSVQPAGNSQPFISEAKVEEVDTGKELMVETSSRTEQSDNIRQKPVHDAELVAQGPGTTEPAGEGGKKAGEFIAVADIMNLPGIEADQVITSDPEQDRINALREMPEYELTVPFYEPAGDVIVLIDENTQEDDYHHDKWAVGTQVSPVYSYRDLGHGRSLMDAKTMSSNTISYYNSAESGMMAYTGGVSLSYLPADRLTVQSGVYYSRMGISIDHTYVTSNLSPENAYSDAFKYNIISNSSGIIQTGSGNIEAYYTTGWSDNRDGTYNGVETGTSTFNQINLQANEGEVIQNFEYLEIPVILKYRVIDRRMGFNILGGMSTNLLVGSDAYLMNEGNKEKIGSTADLRNVNYSSTVGMGMDYALSSRFNLNLEPYFKYYLNSINQSSAIRSRPYSFGVFTGISFLF
jgi:hypothetical protein